MHCKDEECINGNTAYSDLEDAWKMCRYVPECQRIMKYTDGKYYLRRFDDEYEKNRRLKYVDWDCRGNNNLSNDLEC